MSLANPADLKNKTKLMPFTYHQSQAQEVGVGGVPVVQLVSVPTWCRPNGLQAPSNRHSKNYHVLPVRTPVMDILF